MVFLHPPASAWFIGGCALLILARLLGCARRLRPAPLPLSAADAPQA